MRLFLVTTGTKRIAALSFQGWVSLLTVYLVLLLITGVTRSLDASLAKFAQVASYLVQFAFSLTLVKMEQDGKSEILAIAHAFRRLFGALLYVFVVAALASAMIIGATIIALVVAGIEAESLAENPIFILGLSALVIWTFLRIGVLLPAHVVEGTGWYAFKTAWLQSEPFNLEMAVIAIVLAIAGFAFPAPQFGTGFTLANLIGDLLTFFELLFSAAVTCSAYARISGLSLK